MYVLTRKLNESVVVDGFDGSTREITVTVLQVKGGRVQLGLEVNTDVPMHRSKSRERYRGGYKPNCVAGGPEMCGA